MINENDLTMKAVWTPVDKVDETGDLIEYPDQIINTWIIENKTLFTQNENGYSRIPSRGYILLKNSQVKVGDKLDGVFVQKINKINDFDGSVDHIEAFTYMRGTSD